MRLPTDVSDKVNTLESPDISASGFWSPEIPVTVYTCFFLVSIADHRNWLLNLNFLPRKKNIWCVDTYRINTNINTRVTEETSVTKNRQMDSSLTRSTKYWPGALSPEWKCSCNLISGVLGSSYDQVKHAVSKAGACQKIAISANTWWNSGSSALPPSPSSSHTSPSKFLTLPSFCWPDRVQLVTYTLLTS